MTLVIRGRGAYIGPEATATILFDRESKEYFPGEKIRGSIVIQAKGFKTFQGMKVQLQGKIRSNDGPIERIFFEKPEHLLSKDNSLPDGEHVFNYDLKLDEDLPCSFKGKHGSITYSVDMSIDEAKRNIVQCAETFTVLTKPLVQWMDRGNRLHDPIVFDREATSMFLGQGKIPFTFRTHKRGFEPGEDIPFAWDIMNDTKKEIKSMCIQLIQCVKYTKTSRSEHDLLAEVAGPDVPCGAQKAWESSINVPKTAIPNQFGYSECMEITVEHVLKLVLQMSGTLTPNIKEDLEIFIENPLSSNVLTELDSSQIESENLNPADDAMSCDSNPSTSASFGAMSSLPGYEKALTCQKLSTAPPSYKSDM